MRENHLKYGNENMTFRALYLLAIVFVVDGHLSKFGAMFTLGGLFPYYSFHMMLFAFGSGYFFRRESAERPLAAIGKSAGKILLPLYCWNALYGVLAGLLRRFGGFELGEPLCAYSLLLAPILDGQHFVWNLPSWFLFPLFGVQAIYVLLRRASRLWGENPWITLAASLVPGCVCVQLCAAGQSAALPLFLLRTLILLPGYAMGVLYRERLEAWDTLPTVPYLLGIVVFRLLLASRYENLAYLLSDCSYFACDAFGVYAGAVLAIAFWLRIARLLAPHMEKSRLALYISRHTFDIMMHHYMAFFAVNCCFLVVNALGVGTADFSVKSFRTTMGFLYAPEGRKYLAMVYLLAGLLLPLIPARIVEWGKESIRLKGKE